MPMPSYGQTDLSGPLVATGGTQYAPVLCWEDKSAVLASALALALACKHAKQRGNIGKQDITLLMNSEALIYSSSACSVYQKKLFKVGTEKSIMQNFNKFTLNLKNEALFLLMSKSRLLVKFGKKNLYEFVAACCLVFLRHGV